MNVCMMYDVWMLQKNVSMIDKKITNLIWNNWAEIIENMKKWGKYTMNKNTRKSNTCLYGRLGNVLNVLWYIGK